MLSFNVVQFNFIAISIPLSFNFFVKFYAIHFFCNFSSSHLIFCIFILLQLNFSSLYFTSISILLCFNSQFLIGHLNITIKLCFLVLVNLTFIFL